MEDGDSDEEKDLLTKATWREWMNVFSEGKKVSEINLVLEDDDLGRGGMGAADSMAHILGGEGVQHTPYSLMKEVKNEPIYNEFLQYLAQTGPLNLRLIAADKWQNFGELAKRVLA